MNLLKAINNVINKAPFDEATTKEMKYCEAVNRRANIVSMGQLQLRSAITTANAPINLDVNEIQLQQRPDNLINTLGVKLIEECSSNFLYPIITDDNSQWVDETEMITASPMTFTSLSLSPKRLGTYVEYSGEVILNPNTKVSEALQADILNSIHEAVAKKALNGIYDDATVVNNLIDFDSICDLEALGANISNGVYVVSPQAAKRIKLMKNGTTAVYNNGLLNGHRVIETPLLEGNKVIFGNFAKLLIANWGCIDLTVDAVTKMNKGIVALTANSYWNHGVLDPNAFVFGTFA